MNPLRRSRFETLSEPGFLFQVLKEGARATPEELRAFLAKTFAKWRLPDAFVFLDAIPRTSVGKFKKVALREQYANWKWDT